MTCLKCEATEDSKIAKGIAQREVVEVITPEIHTPEQPKENSYIMSICLYQDTFGITVADLSTGEFIIYETDKPVEDEIGRFEPLEILCPESLKDNLYYQEAYKGLYVSYCNDMYFDYTESYKTLLKYFKVSSLEGYGCDGMNTAISSAGALLSYLEDSQKILPFRKITVLNTASYMFVDFATKRNMEIIHNLKDSSPEGSLLWILDETLTPMGSRFLRNAITKPLIFLPEIMKRQNAVEAIIEDHELMEELRIALRKIQDIERLTSRIISKSASPRDLIALRNSVEHLPKVKKLLLPLTNSYIKEIGSGISEFIDLKDLIDYERVNKYADKLLETSAHIAMIDFLLSLAVVARRYDYVKPEISDNDVIEIIRGRHPVIERLIGTTDVESKNTKLRNLDEQFIPNDTVLDCSDNKLLIITGPNMAGKSTYMRQIASIVLMAQIGSFVPAESAKIGIVDRIFMPIGASDYITKGQGTFMVEMIEAANILNNATERSLILLDEMGRGTSTFDGISIAWAVAEHLVKNINARTLFATHYSELTDLALNVDGVKNYNVVVKEWGDEMIFLRRIENGPVDKNYGIQVARLAGLPDKVIEEAKIVLGKLESLISPKNRGAVQMDLFATGDPIALELLNLDVETLTPQKALKKLMELKKKAEGIR